MHYLSKEELGKITAGSTRFHEEKKNAMKGRINEAVYMIKIFYSYSSNYQPFQLSLPLRL